MTYLPRPNLFYLPQFHQVISFKILILKYFTIYKLAADTRTVCKFAALGHESLDDSMENFGKKKGV